MQNTVIERNSNIEFIRIIAICGVMFLHMNAGKIGLQDAVNRDGSNALALILFNAMFIICVDLFMMISGFCGAKKTNIRFSKIIDLIIQTIVVQTIGYLCLVIFDFEDFSFRSFLKQFIPANYFVILYSATYMLSPYINKMIMALSKEKAKLLLIIIFALFCVAPMFPDFIKNATNSSLDSLSTISLYGSAQGYSIVNFLVCYTFGSVVGNHEYSFTNKRKLLYTYGILCYSGEILWMYLARKYLIDPSVSHAYYSPLVVTMAFIVLLLVQMKPIKHNRKINSFARSCFFTYLIHSYLLRILFGFIDVHEIAQLNTFLFVLLIIIIITVYSFCVPLYWIYNKTIGMVINKGILSRMNYFIDI